VAPSKKTSGKDCEMLECWAGQGKPPHISQMKAVGSFETSATVERAFSITTHKNIIVNISAVDNSNVAGSATVTQT
jgi:hypothetical protein